MTLEQVAAELYGLPPAEFVAARTERERQARDAGDKDLAAAIGKLRRPTVAAWALNLLSREASEDVDALLEVGDALRDAQRRLSGEQLRALTTQRQKVVNAVTRKAAELAASRGQRLTEPVLRDIGASLQAALADQSVADGLRAGTLTTAATYEGFGPAALTAVPGDGHSRSEKPSTTADSTEDRAKKPATRTRRRAASTADEPDPQAEVRRELEEMLAEVESARAAVTSARSTHDTAAAELADLDNRIQALRAELTEAEHRRRFTAATERSAREDLQRAQKHLDGIERRVERARKQLTPDV